MSELREQIAKAVWPFMAWQDVDDQYEAADAVLDVLREQPNPLPMNHNARELHEHGWRKVFVTDDATQGRTEEM